MAIDRTRAVRLAHALRDLRESKWQDARLTQLQLAKALSAEGSSVAPATLSSWESTTAPKTPAIARVSDYARFFATRRSLEPEPHLIPEKELEPDELTQFRDLETELLDLLSADEPETSHTFQFETGPVVVICPTVPVDLQGPLAREQPLNYNKLQQYGDLDALIELYGHLRAENPNLDVFHRPTGEVASDDLSSHVILLGGIGWNPVTRRFQNSLGQVPITQVEVEGVPGDIFVVNDSEGERRLYPDYVDETEGRELVADIGYLARLRHPFKRNRTLTICSGIHTRGVFGAVRCLTDASVRDENEKYIANRFPDGEFALLLRVPIVEGEAVSPDLQNQASRLFEWPPSQDAKR